jgi:hypothetical protein
VKSTSEIW